MRSEFLKLRPKLQMDILSTIKQEEHERKSKLAFWTNNRDNEATVGFVRNEEFNNN